MKKHHPHPSATPEALYAKVNKPNRGNQHRQNQQEEVVYASISEIAPSSKGRRPNQGRENPETDYTEVTHSRREEDILYASVSEVTHRSRGGKNAQRKESSETDYTEVSPHPKGRPSSSLTADQISATLLKDPQVQAYAEEVMHWGKIVYGNDKLFQAHLQGILKNPSQGKELSNKLAEDPESMHKLAGRSTLGIKNQTRKAAEDGFRSLVEAIDSYTKVVENATTRLSQTPLAEQRRRQEIFREAERGHRHHNHAREQEQNSPEYSPQRQKHGEKGFSYAM